MGDGNWNLSADNSVNEIKKPRRKIKTEARRKRAHKKIGDVEVGCCATLAANQKRPRRSQLRGKWPVQDLGSGAYPIFFLVFSRSGALEVVVSWHLLYGNGGSFQDSRLECWEGGVLLHAAAVAC